MHEHLGGRDVTESFLILEEKLNKPCLSSSIIGEYRTCRGIGQTRTRE